MASKIPRAERLLNLTAVLLHSLRPLSRDELREKVGGYPDDDNSFRRQFERDKDTLREIGIPLSVVEIPFSEHETGYRIPPEDYYLQGADFTPAELASLHLATMAVQFGNSDEEALWKLGGLGITDLDRLGGEDFESPISELPADANLLAVFESLQRRRMIEFDYRGGSGARRRQLEPWSLDFQRGRWYAAGFDRAADGERRFRLDRMEQVSLSEEEFSKPVGGSGQRRLLLPWEIGVGEPFTAELFVTDAIAAPVAQRVGSGPDRSSELDGRAGQVFDLEVRALDAFVTFCLEWLDDAVVLGPPHAVQAVVAALEANVGRDRSGKAAQ